MRLTLEVKPLKEMRYPTAGDYFFERENLAWSAPFQRTVLGGGVIFPYYIEAKQPQWKFQVIDLDNEDYELLIFIHELIEWRLTQKHGVSEEDITAFDKKHLEADEPGSLKEAPYHKEHMAADAIERMVAILLGVEWNDYEEAINKKFEELKNDTTNQK